MVTHEAPMDQMLSRYSRLIACVRRYSLAPAMRTRRPNSGCMSFVPLPSSLATTSPGKGSDRSSPLPSPQFFARPNGVFSRWKRPGNEGHVASAAVTAEVGDRAILPLPDKFQVVNAIGEAFDVSEHHGGRRIHAQFMGDAHNGQP